MSKNNKEKSSFWKKLGLGKNNKPSTSSIRSEQVDSSSNHDKNSVKSKRQSGVFPSHQPPLPPTIPSNEYTTPALPNKTIKKQPRVNLPKVMDNDHILSTSQQHVDPPTKLDISGESIVTPTADSLHQESNKVRVEKEEISAELKDSIIVYSTEQPNIVTPTTNNKYHSDEEVDNNSNSSFVVLKKSNDTNNGGLLDIIANLKLELENEKATVNALQKQKQAVAKDLDYLELTVDELFTEKTDLLQQLEDEKIKSQQYLNDLNLLLEKQKLSADNAREQSFFIDQTKLEYESIQEQLRKEKEELASELTFKDKTIRELKAKLNVSQEQVETLKSTMGQLVKSHAAELNRVVTQAAAEKEQNALPLHTPNGSPRMKSKEEEQEVEDEWNHPASPNIPVPSSSTPFINTHHHYEHYGTPQSINDPSSPVEYNNDLDDQLTKLLREKEKLQSYYSKIPLSGGGPQSRRRKEELEAMLDHVDSQLSKVKQKIRRS